MACLRDNFAGDVVLDGRYVTISPLNHGSFGMVFMARDLQTNDTVAIKCLTKKVAAQDIGFAFAVDDKSEELVLHSHLGSHPNIVNLIRSFETEAHIYLVLEFCQRGDLYEAIRNGQGPLETEHVRRFMLELVDAVSYIHSKGVYHRDIKPENIFLTDSGAMKLGDFGLATTEKWSLETTVGSDRYMAPEQYDSAGAGYSPAEADIWAIGICLLNVLFSRNPFTTPTEADPLFLDFSRDKQSLFDVFPSMSQDTYEVIVQCMNLDPKKRSLVGARAAICRVVSFTTLDEALDDFCSAEQRRTIATANREPLRTPSIQSPLVDQGSFPWARALHNSPRPPMRTLSAIPDNESYTEELFPRSEESADWFSGSAETPSMASVLGSNLATSMQSLSISRPIKVPQRQATKTSPMAGSLPINMAKPSALSSMSLVFGGHRKEMVSKSWSDMWEEDIEEEESIRNRENLKALNARTWSHESKTNELLDSNDNTILVAEDVGSKPLTGPAEPVDMDADLVADGFFFHEPSPLKQKAIPISTHASVPYSPPTKKSGVDKWTALGERRRAHTATVEVRRSPEVTRTQRPIGFGFGSLGAWEHYSYTQPKRSKDRGKDCPWNKGRDWNWRREKRADLGDVEWVGGWQESHAWPAHHL